MMSKDWWLLGAERRGGLTATNAAAEVERKVRWHLRNANIKKLHSRCESSHKGSLTASISGFYEFYFQVIWIGTELYWLHFATMGGGGNTLSMALNVNGWLLFPSLSLTHTCTCTCTYRGNGDVSLGRNPPFSMEMKGTFNGSLQQWTNLKII